MPTISVTKQDLERLAGKTYPLPELEAALEFAKAEVKVEGDELRVQLKDTNRPGRSRAHPQGLPRGRVRPLPFLLRVGR